MKKSTLFSSALVAIFFGSFVACSSPAPEEAPVEETVVEETVVQEPVVEEVVVDSAAVEVAE